MISNLKLIDYKKYLKLLIIITCILLWFNFSVVIHSYYNYLISYLSVGDTTSQYSVGSVVNVLLVGVGNAVPSDNPSGNLLKTLMPLEIAGLVIMILITGFVMLKVDSSVKGVLVLLGSAIVGILIFLIMLGMVQAISG